MVANDPHALTDDRYGQLDVALAPYGLMIYGGIHPRRVPVPEIDSGTLILIGTAPAFWDRLRAAPEGRDQDPDRWIAIPCACSAPSLASTRRRP